MAVETDKKVFVVVGKVVSAQEERRVVAVASGEQMEPTHQSFYRNVHKNWPDQH